MSDKANITQHYDKDADVLYVDFGSDEPCFTESPDGTLFIDIGWFSKLPRGIRILSPKSKKIQKFEIFIAQVEQTCRNLIEQQVKQIQAQEPMFQDILGETLTQAFSRVHQES
jgi:hypothetical protein